MEWLIAYDVATESPGGERRLRHVAKVCIGHGQRVQKSVFECSLTEAQFEAFEARLLRIIDPDQDSLRIYRLVEPRERHVRSYGVDRRIDFSGPLVI